jgi:hypothetical protein
VSRRGRPAPQRAPIHLHSAGYRFMTQPAATFLQETYELFLARSHWGLLDYSSLSDEQILENAIRNRYANYFERVPNEPYRGSAGVSLLTARWRRLMATWASSCRTSTGSGSCR